MGAATLNTIFSLDSFLSVASPKGKAWDKAVCRDLGRWSPEAGKDWGWGGRDEAGKERYYKNALLSGAVGDVLNPAGTSRAALWDISELSPGGPEEQHFLSVHLPPQLNVFDS